MSTTRNKAIAILMGAAGCLLCPSAVWAAGPDCQNASDQATLNECAGQDFTAADAKLNTTYKQLAKRHCHIKWKKPCLNEARGLKVDHAAFRAYVSSRQTSKIKERIIR